LICAISYFWFLFESTNRWQRFLSPFFIIKLYNTVPRNYDCTIFVRNDNYTNHSLVKFANPFICISTLLKAFNEENLIKCPEINSISTVITGIYMLVSNLILLNILIAIFTDTYKNVNQNIRKVWTNGRYDVILEDYHYMPFGPIIGGIIQLCLILWFLLCCLIRFPVWLTKKQRKSVKFFNKVKNL
jgi:hypothetical protein